MSIRSTYTSKYPQTGIKLYHTKQWGRAIGYQPTNVANDYDDSTRIYLTSPNQDEDNLLHKVHCMINYADDGFKHVYVRKFIYQDFADIIKNITKNFTSLSGRF